VWSRATLRSYKIKILYYVSVICYTLSGKGVIAWRGHTAVTRSEWGLGVVR